MHVALDATPLTVPTGGVPRYVTELSRALSALYPEDRFTLLSDQPFPAPPVHAANLAVGEPSRSRRWWLWGLPQTLRRSGVDVFHGTDFSVPYLPVRPSVLNLLDLSPWRDASWHDHAGRTRRRTPWLLAAGLASLILTPSEAIRREAASYFGLSLDDLVATPLAAAPHLRPVAVEPPVRPYFLFVGTLEPRKNLPFLVEAWREARLNVDLVLCGRPRSDAPELPDVPGLIRLGAVPDESLPSLYAGCTACVYASLYEGFGLPVLEAMQCGAPVLTSRDPAISEVAGNAAIRIDARDGRAWTEAMRTIASRPDLQTELRVRGLARAAEFTWEKTARATHAAYEEARLRFGR